MVRVQFRSNQQLENQLFDGNSQKHLPKIAGRNRLLEVTDNLRCFKFVWLFQKISQNKFTSQKLFILVFLFCYFDSFDALFRLIFEHFRYNILILEKIQNIEIAKIIIILLTFRYILEEFTFDRLVFIFIKCVCFSLPLSEN